MKSRNEIGPSPAIRRRSRSESVTPIRLYFRDDDAGGGPLSRRLRLALALLLAVACASHREPPLPTLEDYSDRVSILAEKFLEDWKTGSKDSRFYARGFSWRGPVPGDGLSVHPTQQRLPTGVSGRW